MSRPVRARRGSAALGRLLLFFPLVALACSSGGPTPDKPMVRLGQSGSRVEIVSDAERPTLAVVEREGDPATGLSMVLSGGGGDAGALLGLAAVVDARLAERGLSARVRSDRAALRVSVWSDEDAAATAQALFAAVEAPVKPAPTLAAAVSARVDALPIEPAPAFTAAATCAGRAGTARRSPLDLATEEGARRVETIRRELVARGHVAFGVTGSRRAREAVAGALPRLPEGAATSGPAPRGATGEAALTGVRTGASTPPDRATLTLAVPAADGVVAVGAAVRLGAPEGPLVAASRRAGVALARAEATAQTWGGCVTLRFDVPLSGPDGAAQALSAFLPVALREARAEAARPGDAAAIGESIAREADPRDAAERAAWWALSAQPGAPPQQASAAATLELPLGATGAAELERALAQAAAPRPAPAPRASVRVRVEQGQARAWVLVASSCALALEGPHRWGASAQAALASGELDAAVVDGGAIGFVAAADAAHADAEALVAEAAARFEARLEPAAVARARQRGARELFERWGRGAPVVDARAEPFLEQPARIEPFGPALRVGRFEPRELEAALREALRGPVTVAALVPGDERGFGERLGAATQRWLPDDPPLACPKGLRPPPGRSVIASSGGSGVSLLFGFDGSPDEQAAAEVVAALLEDATTQRDLGLREAASWRARPLSDASGGLFVITASAPADGLEAVEADVRAGLDRLAAGVDATALARAVRAREERARARLADPRARLLQLALDRPLGLVGPSPDAVTRFIRSRLSLKSAAIVVAKGE